MNDIFAAATPPEELKRLQEQKRIEAERDARIAALPDENGVSAVMLDHAVAVFAEGFSTGQTNVRALLYCVIRDVLRTSHGH
jgi:hypothetical protein